MGSVSKTKKELKNDYGISYQTLNKWLKSVPGLILDRYTKIFTPNQLELIYRHLGKP